MLRGLKREWRRFKQAPVGSRFIELRDRHEQREGPWLKPLVAFSALLAFAMGIIFLVIPGASIPFFVVAAILLPAIYRPAATAYDRVERFFRRGRVRKTESGERPPIDETSADTKKLERYPSSGGQKIQPSFDGRVVWIKPSAPPNVRVAGTTKIWSSDVPITVQRGRKRGTTQTAPVRPSRAVIVVPPPVTITDRR